MRTILTICLLFVASAARADTIDGLINKGPGDTYRVITNGTTYVITPASPHAASQLNSLVGQWAYVIGSGKPRFFVATAAKSLYISAKPPSRP